MKTVTFGEIMLRLAPKGNLRFFQEPELEATFGGGEANVAVSMAYFGTAAAFVTALPANDIGQSAVNELRRFGVDVSHIVRAGKRVGIYYCEKGASQRPSKVIYDRACSSVAESKLSDYDMVRSLRGRPGFTSRGSRPRCPTAVPRRRWPWQNTAEVTESRSAATSITAKICGRPKKPVPS